MAAVSMRSIGEGGAMARWAACAVFACIMLSGLPLAAAEPVPRPNVLLIVVDDLGYAELGCQGCQDIPTPQLDAVAAGGLRFTQGYVSAPYCSPSRAGLFTGRIQTRFGCEFNPVGKANLDPSFGLPTDERTLASYLQAAGYATGLVGKWHLGGTEEFHPLNRGYEQFYGFLHEGHFYVPGPPWAGVGSFLRKKSVAGRVREGNVIWSSHLGSNEPPYDADNPLFRGREPTTETTYLTDAFAREAIAFIQSHERRPWFLTLTFNAPHSPMQAADAYLEKFAHIQDEHRRTFAAMVANLDDAIGRVLAELARKKLEQDTLVIVISDHGGPTRELTSSNAPLRGGKGQLFEGGLRVPLLMRWPARWPRSQVVEQPIWSLDIVPTVLAAAGAKWPRRESPDGIDLLPQLDALAAVKSVSAPASPAPQPAAGRTFFWRYGTNAALRHGDWKLVRQGDGRQPAEGSPPPAWQLFDLSRDPAEAHDRAADEPERLAALMRIYEAQNAEMLPAKAARTAAPSLPK